MALLLGTTAPDMILFPQEDPATGSRIPSMSTGGAAMNASMNAVVAVSKVGIIKTPKCPTYNRFWVDVTQLT